jgi:hypothetical protein
MCTLRKDHEFEDFAEFIEKEFGWQKYNAVFGGHLWEPGGLPPVKDQTVFVQPKLHGGNPKKPPVWPDDAVPLTHITNSAFEWTALAKLSPQQVGTNAKILEILAEVCKLESGPYYVGHILPRIQHLANHLYPFPVRQTQKGTLRADMTIFDVLLELPISKWPPARAGQCFHPECKMARTRMERPDHLQGHHRKRDYVTNILQKLPGSIHVDGESCLTATIASLLNVMAISQ